MRKLRKTLGVALGIAMLMGLCVGCDEKPTQEKSKDENVNKSAVKAEEKSVYTKQIEAIARNRDKWEYPEEIIEKDEAGFYFSVTDLDQDDCLELVTIYTYYGTGDYTAYTIQEVKKDGSGLRTLKEGHREKNASVELFLDRSLVFCDERKGIYHYLTTDWEKSNGADSKEYDMDFYIADNKTNEEVIRYVHYWVDLNKDFDGDTFNTVDYYNGNKKKVSKKKYKKLQKKYFNGMKRGVVFTKDVYGNDDSGMTRKEVKALSEEEWIEKLTASWEGFHIEMEAEGMDELPVVLSKNKVETAGKTYFVNIEMVEGTYSFDEKISPYRGNNWMGNYKVRVYTEEDNIDTTVYYEPICVLKDDDIMRFNREFSLVFDDYNNDGNMDFTLGQYGSSFGTLYSLFSITPEGKVEKLDTGGEMILSETAFSVLLDKITSTSFETRFWNNEEGTDEVTLYQWENNKFAS